MQPVGHLFPVSSIFNLAESGSLYEEKQQQFFLSLLFADEEEALLPRLIWMSVSLVLSLMSRC